MSCINLGSVSARHLVPEVIRGRELPSESHVHKSRRLFELSMVHPVLIVSLIVLRPIRYLDYTAMSASTTPPDATKPRWASRWRRDEQDVGVLPTVRVHINLIMRRLPTVSLRGFASPIRYLLICQTHATQALLFRRRRTAIDPRLDSPKGSLQSHQRSQRCSATSRSTFKPLRQSSQHSERNFTSSRWH